jgi:hypothetical protein
VRSPNTLSDRLLGAVGLSFFGGLFFGNWGLLVGPAHLILVNLVGRFIAAQATSARRREFYRMVTQTVGHAKNEPCNCKKLRQFPHISCAREHWEPTTTSHLKRP